MTTNEQLRQGLATTEFLSGTYPCLYDPATRWDGWYIPYFSLETGLKIVEDLDGLRYDVTRDCFLWPDEDGEAYAPVTLNLAGVEHKLYAIGERSLLWSCSRRFRSEDGRIFEVKADGTLSDGQKVYANVYEIEMEVDLMDDLPVDA